MRIRFTWGKQPDPTPHTDPTDAETDAAIRTISQTARHWIEISGQQAAEIARLRAELAISEAALRQMRAEAHRLTTENDQIRSVAAHWHATAEAQRREALPAVLAQNITRYIHVN